MPLRLSAWEIYCVGVGKKLGL